MTSNAAKLSLAWVTSEMVCQTAGATLVSGAVYVSHSYYKFPVTEGISGNAHLLTGVILGILLVSRVVLGLNKMYEAAAQVQAFNRSCRTIAVLSTAVNEGITGSAGAEIEKKATSRFRFELVRLLNLAFYCYQLMLQGLKLYVPPTALRSPDGSKLEGEVLSAVDNPTVMVCKMIASLLEEQRAAKRISNEQVAVLMTKVGELIDSYHASLSHLLAPEALSLTSFTYFFTCTWAYTAGAALAVSELGDNTGEFRGFGLGLTLAYTTFLSLFVFGLYEAGRILEEPLKAVMALIVTEDMSHSLSDDLASLVDDASVPVFFPKE
jgi:hypothetical protein